jgi:hypothetical protein
MTDCFGFEQHCCINFWTHLRYMKRGATYVKLTHELFQNWKKHNQTMKCSISYGLYNLDETNYCKL